jgi:hypothetical protein
MDWVNGEVGSCTGTGVTATVVGKEVTGVEGVWVAGIKEEDQEPTTITEIKTEPDVSCVPVVIVTLISYRLYPAIHYRTTVHERVLVKQKFYV